MEVHTVNRLAIGAALGGLAVYLYDPERGEKRRENLLSLWRDNKESALQAGRAAGEAVDSARPLARRFTRAIDQGDWREAFKQGRGWSAGGLLKVIGAATITGSLVYLLDPANGSKRRQRLLFAWQGRGESALKAARQGARKAADAVRSRADHVGDREAEVVEAVKSRVPAAANAGGVSR